jgi:predicted Abi (CAAX) family protease
MEKGLVHPRRLRGWRLVTPLESLAGARPHDDVMVMLNDPIQVIEPQANGEPVSLIISREPVQITGRYYGLVTFLEPMPEGEDLFRVRHFHRDTRQFTGPEEVVQLPQSIMDSAGIHRSTTRGIEKDHLNPTGWYIAGAKNAAGVFVVQALAPRPLLRCQPEQIITGEPESVTYVKKAAWKDASEKKGQISSVLLNPKNGLETWQEGDQALLVNTYGGIGNGREPYPYPGGYYFGHFSYGRARVVREPLADELIFDMEYYQVFGSNGDGLVPGILHWTRYIGDRQFGYLGYRPVCDILLKLDCFTQPYDFAHRTISALDRFCTYLEAILHLYRIGGGAGKVFFGMANNCTQDSNQTLYAAIKDMDITFKEHPLVRDMLERHPEEADRFDRLLELGQSLRKTLLPLGMARADWRYNFHSIDNSLDERPLVNILRSFSSWRTITPRWASNAVAKLFLSHGASVWVLRTNQVGNYDPKMVPKAIDP